MLATGTIGLALGWIAATPLLLSPVLEEVFFRLGLHEAWLARGRTGTGRWARMRPGLVTASAFAALHVVAHPGAWSLMTFVPALAIGAVYERDRALLPCVLLHAACNAIWCLGADHFGGAL